MNITLDVQNILKPFLPNTKTKNDLQTNSNSIRFKKGKKRKQKKQNQGSFRISAKKLFLTYSQVPQELDAHQVYLQLQNKLSIQNYVIARETHQDGGFHFHALLVLHKKCNIRSNKTLDITFMGKNFHGNYAPVKCVKQSILYVCKDKEYITDFKNIKDGYILSVPQEILEIFEQQGERAAMLHYFKAYPDQAFGPKGVVNAQRLFKTLDRLKKIMPSVPESPFDLNDFDIPQQVIKWLENGGQPTLLLVGPAGCGKTALVKAIAKDQQWKTLTITNIDGMKDLDKEHDLLFMDDIAGLDKIHPQKLLALLETVDPRNIRVIYDNITKPANLKQIIALNANALSAIREKLETQQVLRRCRIVYIQQPIIININIENLTIFNQHTHIHNNKELIEENKLVLKNFPYPQTYSSSY